MRIEQLPDRKKREIEVGRRFIEEYNRRTGRRYALDESYWDTDPDPAPDLRFAEAREEILAEVVCFDEAGQEGFVRSAATGRLLGEIENVLGSAGAEGFVMMVEPADPRKVPQGRQLRAYAFSLVKYCQEKVKLLREQTFRFDVRHEQAWQFALSNIQDLDIHLSPTPRAHCGVSGGVRTINTVRALEEAIQGKGLKRYGPGTHLLVDAQGHFISSAEVLEMLEGKPVSIDGFEGVWFVDFRNRSVVPLHEVLGPGGSPP